MEKDKHTAIAEENKKENEECSIRAGLVMAFSGILLFVSAYLLSNHEYFLSEEPTVEILNIILMILQITSIALMINGLGWVIMSLKDQHVDKEKNK